MKTLYILSGFNNYYNRMVKLPGDTIEDYPESIYELEATNFVPNDGVDTTHVIGTYDYSGEGDYLLVVEAIQVPADDDPDKLVWKNIVTQRWFIIDSVRNRQGQYTLTLRRDLIADYYNIVTQSPMFIEKATLPYESPLLFNEENITVNQIKKDEILLKDKSKTPWIVGYYSKGKTLEGTVSINDNIDAIALNVQNIQSWKYYPYSTGSELIGPATYGAYRFIYRYGTIRQLTTSYPALSWAEVNQSNGNVEVSSASIQEFQLTKTGVSASDIKAGFINYGLNNLDPIPYSNTVLSGDVQELLSYSGQLVKTLDGKYYTITVKSVSKTKTIDIQSGDLFNSLSSIVKNNIGMSGTPNTSTFKYKFTSPYYTISIKEETDLETTYNITANRLITTDAPWDIFAMPLNPIKVIREDNTSFITNGSTAIATAMSIQAQQSSNVYDIQLLPYCPFYTLLSGDNEIRLTDSRQYSFILDKDNNAVGIILNVPKSNFYFDITGIENEKFKPAQTNIERKVRNQCDKWRLTAPNYSNYFDFSIEKNDGIVYFNVDCQYKPFTPYIHVNPNFGGLYGYDDNSPRGLVCGGDFSLSQIINQWEQYQIQNKNFQNIFDRQIQSMELKQNIQREQQIFNAITGTVMGGAMGAATGAKGGVPGIVAGAAIGTAASAIGGALDISRGDILRNEALNYTKDMFGYQLGNIQALPNTISKVSSLNQNNKIFPILEYYTCTDEEVNAFVNKIAYNGMTVGKIGTMDEFLKNNWSYNGITDKGYIKGQLIRFEDFGEDFHIVNSIAGELFKGVFTK